MREVKIFLISVGGCPMRGYISFGEVSSFYVHFHIKNFCLIFHIHSFRFKIHAGLQVDSDFNTESKFSCSMSSFFPLLSGNSKPTKPLKRLSFYQFGAVREPSKRSSQ